MKINKSIGLSREIIISALNDLDYTINEIEGNIIYASAKASLLSWGEDISIELSEIEKSTTRIKINSASKAQLISWGKNDENIKLITNKIKEFAS